MEEIEEEILAKLSPKVLARAKMASEVQLYRQPTPSTGLNSALRGGIGYGRQTLIWGSKSAGKSTFSLVPFLFKFSCHCLYFFIAAGGQPRNDKQNFLRIIASEYQ